MPVLTQLTGSRLNLLFDSTSQTVFEYAQQIIITAVGGNAVFHVQITAWKRGKLEVEMVFFVHS